MTPIKITIYGAEVKCASCIHLPTAFETKEWLEAAITRKFPEQKFRFVYCDIDSPVGEEQASFAERILDDEFFYPLVVLNGEVVAEGNPKLSSIYEKIKQHQSAAENTSQASG
ncbi:YuzD family protein [Alteribacter keqinensis]|uniref:DUF1462 family protein n=1 Tax=Alteribacter keqinensis TaxID=2483800 RepID=A0A3M7TP42_9BACI|nr:YuzD family protein [Alteribacter keqinensis]RNA67404.1 DUF1462 family protein [Alteribacter keqinensis]